MKFNFHRDVLVSTGIAIVLVVALSLTAIHPLSRVPEKPLAQPEVVGRPASFSGTGVTAPANGAAGHDTVDLSSTYYYPNVPARIATPEMAVKAYFDALSHAANLKDEVLEKTGSVACGLEPYPVAYGYWSKDWQASHSYDQFLASWEGTANVELLQMLPAGMAKGQDRYFVEVKEIKAIEGVGLGIFYYAGFITVVNTDAGWRLTGVGLAPEDPAWGLGGHQPWRSYPPDVAQAELLADKISVPDLGEPVISNNSNGSVTVKFFNPPGNEKAWVTMVLLQEGTLKVIDGAVSISGAMVSLPAQE
jgi:hypothetical protein